MLSAQPRGHFSGPSEPIAGYVTAPTVIARSSRRYRHAALRTQTRDVSGEIVAAIAALAGLGAAVHVEQDGGRDGESEERNPKWHE